MQAGPLTYAAARPTTSCIYAGNNMLLLLFSTYIIPHWRNVIFFYPRTSTYFLLLRIKSLNLSCDLSDFTSHLILNHTLGLGGLCHMLVHKWAYIFLSVHLWFPDILLGDTGLVRIFYSRTSQTLVSPVLTRDWLVQSIPFLWKVAFSQF